MAASYPLSVKSFTALNTGDIIEDTHPEAAYDEITAIEQALLSTGLAHNLTPDSSANARTLGTTTKFWGLSYLKGLAFAAATELTIATGAITVTQGYHKVDTEADAAADDLDTITAGSGIVEGSIVILRAGNVTRVVTLKDGTGNLLLNGDFALSATDRSITLYYDGTNWREQARSVSASTTNPVRVFNRDVTQAEVVNTASETTVYSITVTGGTLGSTKGLRLTLIGDYLNDSGSTRDVTVRVKLGATTIFSGTPTASLGASATRRPVIVRADVSAFNATNAQVAYGQLFVGNNIGVTGTGGVLASGGDLYGVHAGVAEDSTADKTLSVTVQHSAASASLSLRVHTVQLELLD